MKTPAFGRYAFTAAAFSSVFLAGIWSCGCKTEGPAGPMGPPGIGNLQDPAIVPDVISTSPANQSIGPFNLYSPGTNGAEPNFVIQFNKLINTSELRPSMVTVRGFERPVRVLLDHDYYPVRSWNKATNDQFDNVLAFNINDSMTPTRSINAVGKTYIVTIDSSITDINGNHMAHDVSFSFTPEPYFRPTTFFPPARSSDIGPNPAIFLVFNSQIDTSILRYLHIAPAHRGIWRLYQYDSLTVDYSYERPLPFDTTFTLTLDAGAADVYGNRTTTPYISSFRTAAFRVLNTQPHEGQVRVQPAGTISAAFSGPADTGSIAQAFELSPNTEGVLAPYFDGSGFEFIPAYGFLPSTQYTLTISTQLRAVDGTQLSSPFSLSFTTDQFRVIGAYPPDGEFNVGRELQVDIYFNSVIDTASARAALTVVPSVSGQISVYPGNRYGGGEILFDHLSDPFAANTTYTVTVDTTVATIQGYHLGSPFTFSFTTGR